MTQLITPELAYRLRYERGLILPAIAGKYSSTQLHEIAQRQAEAFKVIEECDIEIKKMYESEMGPLFE